MAHLLDKREDTLARLLAHDLTDEIPKHAHIFTQGVHRGQWGCACGARQDGRGLVSHLRLLIDEALGAVENAAQRLSQYVAPVESAAKATVCA
jgi:hypothetical protein